MQWDDARFFLAFAREGSFNLAAKRLGADVRSCEPVLA